VIVKKSYKKLRTELCKTYEKLTTASQVSYENVKFAATTAVQHQLAARLTV